MEKACDNTNQFWVHLSGFADGNIFAIYPKILEEIFLQEEQCREEEQRHEIESTTLPSDMEWRLKVYFRLVEKQREMDDMPPESPALEKLKAARRWSRPDSATDPWATLGALAASGAARRAAKIVVPRINLRRRDPPWGPRDLAKASRLLERSPLPVSFDDDQEMRRVYSLIYDVFRYKGVLEEALCEAGFYQAFTEAENRKSLAWLLLFDQQRRRWAKRDLPSETETSRNLKEARERSRSRRKMSRESLRMSRDSSADSRRTSRLSRDSSLEAKDGRLSRNSLIRTKVRAVREMSMDAKEAIRQARESSDVKNGIHANQDQIGDKLPNNHANDIKSKYQMILNAKEMEREALESKLEDIDSIQEECDQDDIKENGDIIGAGERKFSRDSIDSVRNHTIESNEDLEYTISRNEMRNVMESSAGEIGTVVKTFDIVLWDHRVRIAAAIAKIRIRNKALTLSELLPAHLRDERVSASLHRDVITGWVNVFKSRSITELVQRLNEMGYSYSTSRILQPNQFRFDRLCPKFITLKPAVRSELVRSSLLVDNIIVLQEREFCLGAAALCRALREAQIHGDVVQTHGTSPRAAAYLAAQLRDWPAYQGHLIVFGAGERKSEYEGFLRALGATNARVFAEGVGEAGGSLWAGVVAALAAPPNSYSAVGDPIDLVCSRGGDLGMLEVLTESEMSLDGKNRVMRILEEQKKTLRLCMSKPQIQIVMYETHSALSAENGDMVRRAIAEANRAARELHALRRMRARDALPRAPKCASQPQPMDTDDVLDEIEDIALGNGPIDKIIPSIDTNVPDTGDDNTVIKSIDEVHVNVLGTEDQSINKMEDKIIPNKINTPSLQALATPTQLATTQSPSPIDPDSEYADIKVPDCDLFEEEVPHPLAEMSAQDREGCFLALIRRKELIRMNAKYMINVAEARGLFGGNAPPPRRPPPTRKKADEVDTSRQTKRKISKNEMERIAAPTHAWSARVGACSLCSTTADYATCDACARRHAALVGPRARIWWRLAIQHALRANSPPLRLPRSTRSHRPPMSLPVAKPRFDRDPEPPHYGCTVYTKILEAIQNI